MKAIAGVLLLAGAAYYVRQRGGSVADLYKPAELPASFSDPLGDGMGDRDENDYMGELQSDEAKADEREADMINKVVPVDANANVRAFLACIRYTEGTANQSDPYRVCYGYSHTVRDMSNHPAVTGEWRGLRLSDAQCREVGLNAGCVSSAAGAYQILKPTWLGLGMPDFSPASQDSAAIKLLRQIGAYSLITKGKIKAAATMPAMGKMWASMPSSALTTQGKHKLSTVLTVFKQYGGVVTDA